MVINLPKGCFALCQLCLETVETYRTKEDPTAAKRICEQIFQDSHDKIDLLIMEPSCAVLALFDHITLKDSKNVLTRFGKNKLPDWEDINISDSREKLVQDLKAKDDTLAKKIAMIAFCLSYPNEIYYHNKPLCHVTDVAPDFNPEPDVKEVGEEGEEDHDTEND